MNKYICPICTELLPFIPRVLLPQRYVHLLMSMSIPIKNTKDFAHLANILVLIPLDLDTTHVKTLQSHIQFYSELDKDENILQQVAVHMFLFIVCTYDVQCLVIFTSKLGIKNYPSPKLKEICLRIMLGIQENQRATSRVIDKIISAIIKRELDDRFGVMKYYMDLPVYVPLGLPVLIVASAHFSMKFVEAVRTLFAMYISAEKFDKMTALVRQDVNMFCQALRQIPPRFPSSERFEEQVWGKKEPHEAAGQWMLGFCSLYPVKVYECMDWVILPSERGVLTQLSNPPHNWTVKLEELLELFLLCR